MSKRTILAVFAHPDDEGFGTGGTLARYAAEGCDVHLVTATRGEAGEISRPELATAANLPQVREAELRCACEAYGIHPPHFLDYIDGQLTVVNQGQAVGKLVRIMRELRPQVVITFGPEGVYGHYDHIAVNRWATIAFDMASDPACFPDSSPTCQPHRPDKLYYSAVLREQVQAFSGQERPAVMMDGVPFYFEGRRREEVTTVIDIRDYLWQKARGILCHATQMGAGDNLEEMQGFLEVPAFHYEYFVLARSNTAPGQDGETDLFAGVAEL